MCWETSGIGCSLFCISCMCCIPEWIRAYRLAQTQPLQYYGGYQPQGVYVQNAVIYR